MIDDDDNIHSQTLESWVINKCEQWRDHYESNYAEVHDEY